MLTNAERRMLLRLSRQSIECRFLGTRSEEPVVSGRLAEPRGAFVTLHESRSGHAELRGCIGRIEPSSPLYRTVMEMAAAAAFEDYRFGPLEQTELGAVSLEISVLSPLSPLRDPELLEPGTHGLVIRLGGRSGLLLPQVAVEQRWDRSEFLSHVCRKAGLRPDSWRDRGARLSIFTAEVFDESEFDKPAAGV